jgi:hypothetical protein
MAEPADQAGDGPRRRWPRRLVLAGVPVLLLVVLAGVGAAMSVHTYRAAQSGKAELTAFETSLKDRDFPAAQRHLDQAEREFDSAAGSAWPLRSAAALPGIGRTAEDAGRLLDGARALADAGRDVMTLQQAVTRTPLVDGGKLQVERIRALQPTAASLRRHAETARASLAGIRGEGPYGARLLGMRDEASGQVEELASTARLAEEVLTTIPVALGGTKQYLVTTLNYAELHGGGGAPLGLATLLVQDGGVQVLSRRSTGDLDIGAAQGFTPLPNDPWLAGARNQSFINANLSPDFATDGEEMLRLYEGWSGTAPTGVIAVDPSALAAVLRLTGPISAPGIGTVGADDLIQKLLVDAYAKDTHDEDVQQQRHRANEALMDATFVRLLASSPSSGDLEGLLDVARQGHVKIYSRDAQVQGLVRTAGLSGELAPFTGDQVGVWTFNTNASKVDVWQRRAVDQQVAIRPDGSADVVRTVTITNDVGRACDGEDDRRGYDTCITTPFVATSVPAAATGISLTVRDPGRKAPGNGRPGHHLDEAGRQVWAAKLDLERGEQGSLLLRYRLPASALKHGYTLRYDGQAIATDPTLAVRVTPAPGRALSGEGWTAKAGVLSTDLKLVGSGDLALHPS